MLISALPTRLPKAFADSGTKNTIPTASQIGITPGAASLTDGFPPLTMTPIAAGGVPPSGADMNGILNGISAHTKWMNAGGTYTWDSTFQTAIGGYPKCAMVQKADNSGWWVSTVDGNTTNPDTGGAGWVEFTPQGGAQSLGSSGYKKLPGGLIIQWGFYQNTSTPLPAGGIYVAPAQSFPISFPNGNLWIAGSSTFDYCIAQAHLASASQFVPYFSNGNGVGAINVNLSWIAIGY